VQLGHVAGKNMLLDVVQDYSRRPVAEHGGGERSSQEFKLTAAEIDALPGDQLKTWIKKLSGDALFNRVISEVRAADPKERTATSRIKICLRKSPATSTGAWRARPHRFHLGHGRAVLGVTLAPGQSAEVRFTLGGSSRIMRPGGQEVGHMYANWFKDAAEVNAFLSANYRAHREETEKFAKALADTSLGSPLSFVWSSQWNAGQEHLVDQGGPLLDLGGIGLLRAEHDGRGFRRQFILGRSVSRVEAQPDEAYWRVSKRTRPGAA